MIPIYSSLNYGRRLGITIIIGIVANYSFFRISLALFVFVFEVPRIYM